MADHAGEHTAPASSTMTRREDRLRRIAALTEQNRAAPDPEIETELVSLRHDAFDDLVPEPPAHPPPAPPTSAGVSELLELDASELDVSTLRASIARQGCALVRNLVDPVRAETLRHGIDCMFTEFDGSPANTAAERSWYQPFVPRSGEYRIGGRKWMREGGGLWAVDSPPLLFELCELIADTGIGDLVGDHLGERPALSGNKCNVRRVPVTESGSWHQDGAFLGSDVRTLNLWLSLSACGVDAPGLDIVPRRLDHVVETGSEGTYFDWSVAPDVVAEACGDVRVLRPVFDVGDALLFDQFFLHRTAIKPSMTRERYAIETWFFAPSAYPSGQIPLVY